MSRFVAYIKNDAHRKKYDRIAYMDVCAGIMIIWLLYYHALYPMFDVEIFKVFPWLFFFMPWFFYKSGYFFRLRSLQENTRKDANKLLRQFAIWSIIGYVFFLLHSAFLYHDITLKLCFYRPFRSLVLAGSVPMNNALWFLLTLFFVRLIATFTLQNFSALIIGFVSMLVACLIHFLNIRYMPYTIYSVAWGLCFFSSGYFFKKYEQNKLVIAVSLGILFLTYMFTDIPEVYCKEKSIAWYWYVLWYPACIAGCVVFDNICRWIEEAAQRFTSWTQVAHTPFFGIKWVGRHSMLFYVTHYIIFRIVFDIIAKYNELWYDGWQGLVIITIAYLVIIIPLCIVMDKIHAKYE